MEAKKNVYKIFKKNYDLNNSKNCKINIINRKKNIKETKKENENFFLNK